MTDDQSFGTRTAACEDCNATSENAIDIMEDVLLGERKPENWWCEQHIKECNEETRTWAENRET